TELYTLSLHDALPISRDHQRRGFGGHMTLHSFVKKNEGPLPCYLGAPRGKNTTLLEHQLPNRRRHVRCVAGGCLIELQRAVNMRSEEHTSELQSPYDL